MRNQKGLTLIELTITVALTTLLGYGAFKFLDDNRKTVESVTEDLQAMIQRFGVSKVITRDLGRSEGSFNYINLKDSQGYPFFVLSRDQLCMGKNCSREFLLDIPEGKRISNYFYLLVKKPVGNESMKFTIDLHTPYNATNAYAGINWKVNDPNFSITKTAERTDSPWEKERLLLLSSEMDFYDCYSKINSIDYTRNCPISCKPEGSCNYAVKRPFKFLGVVGRDLKDLEYYEPEQPEVLRTSYLICRPDKLENCRGLIDLTTGIKSPKVFFDKLPFIPGSDNRTSLTPVELIRYHLERPLPNSPDHLIELHRTPATIMGKKLVFKEGLVLMRGLKSIVFTRANISSPIIEYKLRKVRSRKSVR